MKKLNLVISAFPGTGKSTATKSLNSKNWYVKDSDSSTFDKSEFPQNYLQHIEKYRHEVDVIFVSSHKVVREALKEAKIPYISVFPEKHLRQEYLKRYKERGSPEAFIKLLDENWRAWLDDMEDEKDVERIILRKEDTYLEDALIEWINKHK